MCQKLNRLGHAVDFVLVSTALQDAGLLDGMGGRAYINDLVMGVTHTAGAGFHVAILEKNYKLRQLNQQGRELVELTEKGGNPDEIMGDFLSTIHKLSIKEGADDKISMLDTPSYVSDNLESTNNNNVLLFTGYPLVDKVLGGTAKGDVLAIGAYTSIGKSIFCECIAVSAHHQDIPVHIFSLEMNRREYLNRIMANLCEIPLNKFKTKSLNDKELAIVKKMEEKFFTDFDLTIYDRATVDTDYIYNKLVAEKKRKGELGLVIVDHIHLMKGKGFNEKERLSQISETLKHIAMELDCYMIMVCQLKRTSYTNMRTGEIVTPKPSIHDFKESGDIENVANQAVLLHRQDRTAIITEVSVAKNRDGEVGMAYLEFFGQFAKFKDSQRVAL